MFHQLLENLIALIVDGDEGGGDTGGDGCIIWIHVIDYLLKQMCPAHLICADVYTHRKAQKGYTEVEEAGKII